MSCSVYLDSCNYSAGDLITGRVVCNFNSGKGIRGVRVRLWGKERTSWTDSEEDYSGLNTILGQQIDVCGAGHVGPGRLEYPFSFVLPQSLPDTYKNQYGYIEYRIKANVDIPWASDYEGKQVITLKTPIDLKKVPNLRLGKTRYEEKKTPLSLFRSNHPVTMSVVIDKDGFAVGEVVNLEVRIFNQSKERIEGLKAKIKSKLITKTKPQSAHKKYQKQIIASASAPGVDPESERICNMAVNIPESTFVPNFSMSTLYELRAKLTVEAVISGLHRNLKVKIPLVLGHIPVTNKTNVCYKSAASTSSNRDLLSSSISLHAPGETNCHSELLQQESLTSTVEKSMEAETEFKGNELPSDPPPSYDETIKADRMSKNE